MSFVCTQWYTFKKLKIIVCIQLLFQIAILNTNNLQSHGITYSYQIQIILNRSIWLSTGTPTLCQRSPGRIGNRSVVCTLYSYRTGASPSDAV